MTIDPHQSRTDSTLPIDKTDNISHRSAIVHQQLRGKIGIYNKMPITTHDDLSLAYTPGVAEPCRLIAESPERARELTIKRNTVAVVSDGPAVLGLVGQRHFSRFVNENTEDQ
ncbi:MAG: hypothetical protein ABGZ53_33025 [Fuerstiella sp.]